MQWPALVIATLALLVLWHIRATVLNGLSLHLLGGHVVYLGIRAKIGIGAIINRAGGGRSDIGCQLVDTGAQCLATGAMANRLEHVDFGCGA